MKVVDAHQHIRKGTTDLDQLVSSGIVDRAWLLSIPGAARCGGDEEVLAAHKRYPDFFVPFGYLDFLKSPDVVDELHAKGFVGLKAIWPPRPYDDHSLFPFYERAERLGMPVVFHAAGAVYNPDEHYCNVPPHLRGGRYMHVYALDIIAKTFPELIIIGAHLGAPWYDEAMNIASWHPNVYFDISDGFLIHHIHKIKEALADPRLDSKLLLGTDKVPTAVEEITEEIHFWSLFLKCNTRSGVRQSIMSGTAERILSSAQGKDQEHEGVSA